MVVLKLKDHAFARREASERPNDRLTQFQARQIPFRAGGRRTIGDMVQRLLFFPISRKRGSEITAARVLLP